MTITRESKATVVQKLFEDADMEPPDDETAVQMFDAAVQLATERDVDDASYELKMLIPLAKEHSYEEVVRIMNARL